MKAKAGPESKNAETGTPERQHCEAHSQWVLQHHVEHAHLLLPCAMPPLDAHSSDFRALEEVS